MSKCMSKCISNSMSNSVSKCMLIRLSNKMYVKQNIKMYVEKTIAHLQDNFHIYFRKWFFWPSKLYFSLWAQGKKTFLSTLNVMILQTMRNECERFGGHVDIEVSYKILELGVLKETQNLHNLSCFE
jgi:hypothetical protein